MFPRPYIFLRLGLMLALAGLAPAVQAQTTYLQQGIEEYQLLDRLETKSGSLTNEFFTTVKPISRKGAVSFLLEQQADTGSGLSLLDRYNIERMISVNGEWTPDGDGAIDSRRPWFKRFYKKQPDFFHLNKENFFLVVNPVLNFQVLHDRNTDNSGNRVLNTRGVEVRGRILNKVGFYTMVTENQEQTPRFVSDWISSHRAVPGVDFFTVKGKDYDYMQARGYIDFAAVKDHINVTFGYDRHFIGDGMRSLLLSDFSAGATFLRLNTKIWKLNYQNLFLELTPQFYRGKGGDSRLKQKYAAIHMLNVNVTRWLNLGFYESVIFGRPDRYEFRYLIPVIFYRSMERGLGSPDNVNIGFTFKAIAARKLQFYGQFMLDEFTAKELFGGRGYWANKFGLQLGGKYFDVAGIKNLDIQGEMNLVRPYTYSHFDSVANYTHYNQPLAHPLEANFLEFLGIIRYQPLKDLFLSFRGMYYQQGTDTAGSNNGANIFMDYRTRSSNYDISLIHGVRATCLSGELNASYELRENLFIDLGAGRRVYSYEDDLFPRHVTNYVYGGLRLNIARRDYNFY